MEEGIEFDPEMKNDSFAFFNLKGFMFGLFDASSLGEKLGYGNNCALSLHVDDANMEVKRIGEFAKIVMPVTAVSTCLVFQIEDSEGNVVEFYSTLIRVTANKSVSYAPTAPDAAKLRRLLRR